MVSWNKVVHCPLRRSSYLDTAEEAAAAPHKLGTKRLTQVMSLSLQVRVLLMVNFVIMLFDVFGICNPHVAQYTSRSKQLFGAWRTKKAIPARQEAMKGLSKH